MISSNELSALKPSASARRGSNRLGQPATMRTISGSGSRRIRAATLSPAIRRSAAICSADGATNAGHGEIDARRRVVLAVEPGGMDQKADGRARAGVPVQHTLVDRQHRLLAGERLADDRRKETRTPPCSACPAAPRCSAADADAVEKAAPGVVGKQQLDHRFLRAVGGQRRQREIVADRFRERRAEHRDRGSEHDPRPIGAADQRGSLRRACARRRN